MANKIVLDTRDKLFLGIIIFTHLFFLLLACYFKKIYMGDSSEYIYEALNIKNLFFFYSGNPAMPIEPELMTQRQPLYPLFLSYIYLFKINNWFVLIIQNVLSIFNIFYCRKIILKFNFKKQYDWLLLLLIITYPAQFINASTIAPDILLQTFTLIYFGSFISLIQFKQPKYAIAMGFALIAGFMVKPVLYPFVLLHIVMLIVYAVYNKLKLQRIVVIALIPLIGVLFYNYWNYTRTQKFHFSSNQAFNAIYYYYPFISTTYGADSANKFLLKERAIIASIPQYRYRYDYANDRGMQLLQQNYIAYLLFHIKNSIRIFLEPGKGELDLFTGKLTYSQLYSKEQAGFYYLIKTKDWSGLFRYFKTNFSIIPVFIVLLFNCLRTIAFVYFFFNKNMSFLVRLFLFTLVSYFAIAAGPIANTRYFLPVSLLVIFAATLSLSNFVEKRRSKPF